MSAEDLDYWAESYQRAVDEVVAAQGTSECETKLRRARGVKKSYALELRLVRDKELKSQHEARIRTLDATCSAMNPNPHSTPREQLFEVKTNDDYLEAAHEIQDQTDESLGRTMKLVEASKEVGETTLDVLGRQGEQIRNITDDVTRIEDNLTRADKLIRNFTKRMMTDKLIQFFAFLNFLALLIVIIYISVTGKGLDTKDRSRDNPDE